MVSKDKRRKRLGFTLIELLVVVMVISILSTLAVARYLHTKDRGYVAAAAYDLDIVRKFLAFYSIDWSSYPSGAVSYNDLQSQLRDSNGNSYGRLPHSGTFQFVSYALDNHGDYIMRVKAMDNGGTILVATPETIQKE